MSIRINHTQVRLERDPDNVRRYIFVVAVYSQKEPGLKASIDIDPSKFSNGKGLTAAVMDGAALSAVYLGTKYGDNIDDAKARLDARDAVKEEILLMHSLGAAAPEKVKNLEGSISKLTNLELELLYAIKSATDAGEQDTPKEMAWLDKKLTEVLL